LLDRIGSTCYQIICTNWVVALFSELVGAW